MKHPRTWILIADSAMARVVSDGGEGRTLASVDDIRLEGNNQPDRDLAADRPGRTFDRAGTGRHGMEPRTGPRRVEHERFAREIAEALELAGQQDRYDRLVLVAPPKMMGDLRGLLPPAVAKTVSAELTKDLTKISIHDLPAHLEAVLSG